MKAVFRNSTFVRAGMVLGSVLAVASAGAQDAAIVGWGDSPVVVPGRVLEDLVAGAAGEYHSLGLKAFYGDLNGDGAVDFNDIDPFVELISGG